MVIVCTKEATLIIQLIEVTCTVGWAPTVPADTHYTATVNRRHTPPRTDTQTLQTTCNTESQETHHTYCVIRGVVSVRCSLQDSMLQFCWAANVKASHVWYARCHQLVSRLMPESLLSRRSTSSGSVESYLNYYLHGKVCIIMTHPTELWRERHGISTEQSWCGPVTGGVKSMCDITRPATYNNFFKGSTNSVGHYRKTLISVLQTPNVSRYCARVKFLLPVFCISGEIPVWHLDICKSWPRLKWGILPRLPNYWMFVKYYKLGV